MNKVNTIIMLPTFLNRDVIQKLKMVFCPYIYLFLIWYDTKV